MQQKTAKTSATLEDLFPDPAVRSVVKRVKNNKKTESGGHNTSYDLLDKNLNKVKSAKSEACFASLGIHFKKAEENKKKIRYIRHLPENIQVERDKALNWINLLQELDIIPEDDLNPDAKAILDNGPVYDLDGEDYKISPTRLYLSLCLYRHLREAPHFVLNVYDLVENAGRDFWAAVVYCHAQNVGGPGHSILSFGAGPYGVSYGRTSDLGQVVRFYDLVNSPETVDDRHVFSQLKKGEPNWRFFETLRPVKNIVLAQREMLLSSDVYPAIACGNINRAERLIKQMIRRGKTYVRLAENTRS